jgi:hypothetical protein
MLIIDYVRISLCYGSLSYIETNRVDRDPRPRSKEFYEEENKIIMIFSRRENTNTTVAPPAPVQARNLIYITNKKEKNL